MPAKQKERIFQVLSRCWREYVWPYIFHEKSAAWTAIFTGFLVLFTYFLYQVADRTEETSEAVQRAFVVYKDISSVRIVDPGTKKVSGWQFAVLIENSGTTPTKDALDHVSYLPRQKPIPKDFNFPDLGDTAERPMVVGPKATMMLTPSIVAEDVILQAQKQASHLYVYGWVTYRDIFPRSPLHITKFCYELTQVIGDTSDPNTSVEALFTSCAQHNCSDDECKQS